MKKINNRNLLFLTLLFVITSGCGSNNDQDEHLPIPAPLDFTTQGSDMHSVVVNWEAISGATAYEIQYADTKDMTDAQVLRTEETSVTVTNLEQAHNYYFKGRAKLSSGWSAWSETNQMSTATFKVSVTSYNVLGIEADPKIEPEFAWNKRKEALKAMILQENNNADIIAFQETALLAPEISDMLSDHYDSHISEREVSARLISWKPDKFELVSYNNSIDIFGAEVQGNNTARYVGNVRLREIESGEELLVYNVHVPASTNLPRLDGQKIRQIGARNLAEYVRQQVKETGLPAIVMGDLNNYFDTVVEGVKSAPKVLSESGFVDTYQQASFRTNEDYSTTVNRATSSVKPGAKGSRRLDYIFTYPKEQVSVGDYSILINFSEGSSTRLQTPVPSDHHPVKSILYFSYP